MGDESSQECAPSTLPDNTERIALRAGPLSFSLAQETEELLEAYKLVYKSYLRAEYIDKQPSEMRYNVFNALPATTTVVAKTKGSVVTTASIVFDSELGLPMDTIYQEEVDALRREGARLCEVTMLADRRRAGIRTIPSILQIFKMIFNYARSKGKVSDILITINPSHEIFYTRYVPFEDFAGLRYYAAVKGAPALAKRANIQRLLEDHKGHKLYEFFTQDRTPEDVLEAKAQFSEDDLRELFVEKRPIFPPLPKFAMDYIKSCYPTYDFARIMSPVEK